MISPAMCAARRFTGRWRICARIVEEHPVDAIFIALPAAQTERTEAVLQELEQCMADVRLVPDINPAFTMRPDVSRLEGVPILSLRQSPLYGWKRESSSARSTWRSAAPAC